jgi:hypothetical protein
LSAQPQANKPGVRRPTSSRRFDYSVVKEQHKKRFAASDLAIWLKLFESDQRKERNDNAQTNSVKRSFADSIEAANTRINRAQPAGRLSVGANRLLERRVAGRVYLLRVVKEIRSAASFAGCG